MGEIVKVIGSLSQRNNAQNGQFDFFQRRGSSPSWSNIGNLYTADRWFRFKQTGGGTGVFTNVQNAGLGNDLRSIKIGRTAGSTDLNQTEIIQALETQNSTPLKGQKITFSFKVRKGADFSGPVVNFYIGTGTGTDQGVVTAWTGQQTFNATPIPAASLSTSLYYQAKMTIVLPANVNQVRYDINYVPTGTAGANDWIEITEVMLNLGEFTPYVRHAENFDAELLVMKRYYEHCWPIFTTAASTTYEKGMWTGLCNQANLIRLFNGQFEVEKRTDNPIFIAYSFVNTANQVTQFGNAGPDVGGTLSYSRTGSRGMTGVDTTSGISVGVNYWFHWTSDAEL